MSGIWWGVLGLEWVAEAAELDGVEGWAEVGVVVFDAGLAYGLAELAGGFVALAGADVGEGVEDCFGEFVLAGGEAAVGVAESDGVLVRSWWCLRPAQDTGVTTSHTRVC